MPWLVACVYRPHAEGTPTDWEYTVWVDDEDTEGAT